MRDSRLQVSAAPHLPSPDSTPKIMWNVVGSLVPIVAAGVYFFGPTALLVVLAATLGAILPEWVWGAKGALRDGSAVITGILLALTLPPGIPLWMAFLGGAFAIGIGKLVFGGLGQNIFNPALLGRAFLQAAFPVALTTWPKPGLDWWALRGDTFALPLMGPHLDTITQETPLGLMKFPPHTGTDLGDLLFGSTGGCIGETSALLILICGGYLALRNFLNWRIPVGIFATAAILATVTHLLNERYPGPDFTLLAGGMMLGAVFMATDMVTSPVTHLGSWIYAAGIGILVVVIRLWGGLAEGVMYSILLMNALVPFINRATQPKVFGTGEREVAA